MHDLMILALGPFARFTDLAEKNDLYWLFIPVWVFDMI
jgi:hypothetical protein